MYSVHIDLASQYFMRKTCWVDFTSGSLDWTVGVYNYTRPMHSLLPKKWQKISILHFKNPGRGGFKCFGLAGNIPLENFTSRAFGL